MIWGKTDKEKDDIQAKKDAHWFAWHPVKLEDGRWVWLEYMARRYYCYRQGGRYEYRRLK